MTVCLDTNVLLQARAQRHRYRCILQSLISGRMRWAVSNSIVTEYFEILSSLGDAAAVQTLVGALAVAAARGTLIHVSPAYQFQIIKIDADDNKFTDCAICAHADYVITEDRHFAPLANAGYKPQPITPDEFIARYRGVYV
jgi:uncharacterized protein